MPLDRMQPNQSQATLFPYTTGTAQAAEGAVDFGFPARTLVIVNDRASAVYLNLNSSTPTTGGFKTCAGEQLVLPVPGGASMLSAASSATSTGTHVRVLALG